MSDLRELYQQVILDHNRNPRNFHELPNATRAVDGYNPLCGDHYKIYVEVDGHIIKDIGFTGNGCAISKATSAAPSARMRANWTCPHSSLAQDGQSLPRPNATKTCRASAAPTAMTAPPGR